MEVRGKLKVWNGGGGGQRGGKSMVRDGRQRGLSPEWRKNPGLERSTSKARKKDSDILVDLTIT